MSLKQILGMPYIQFVLGMLDAPSIDYKNKNKGEKMNIPQTAEQEVGAVINLFN